MTFSRTADRYAVHELLTPEDIATPCDPPEILHSSENVGEDILCDERGFWREFAASVRTDVVVDAGPIKHRGIDFSQEMQRQSY
jgi:ribonuclease Z